MKKEDLKYKNAVEFRNGERGLLCGFPQNEKAFLLLTEERNWCSYLDLSNFDDMLIIKNNKEYDVMKVYEDYTCSKLLWERPKYLLTEEEKEYLKAVIKPFKDEVDEVVVLSLCIYISLEDDKMILPFFKNLPFKFEGLQRDKHYTLKELGLED